MRGIQALQKIAIYQAGLSLAQGKKQKAPSEKRTC